MYEVFQKLCEEKGVTVYKVCKETGISTASISNWKAGRYTIKTDKLQKLADYFGVTLEYLTTGEDPDIEEKLAALPYDKEQIEKAIAIYDKYQNAPPEIQAAVETLLKASQPRS